jgi:hypothetical protein
MKSPKIVDLSERQIHFIAGLGGVMTVFTGSTVVG